MKTYHCHLAANIVLVAMLTMAGAGCIKHQVAIEPIRVEPIHITVDVNLRVDRRLDEFYDFQDKPPAAPVTAPTEQR